MYLKQSGSTIYVDSYAMEVYLPSDYALKGYQGTRYYSLVGNKIRFFCVGNMRFYSSAKEMDQPLNVKTHALGVPMFIVSIPSDIDTRDVQFSKNGPMRKCIVLTYYKNDVFCENNMLIKSADNAMLLFARLDSGRLNHVGPETAVSILQDVQAMNGIKLRIPSENEEIYISERYRDPNKSSLKARFSDVEDDADKIISYNLRQEMMQASTYQATVGEDINNALITSINRKRDGVVEEPSAMECIVRGLDISELVERRDAYNRDMEE